MTAGETTRYVDPSSADDSGMRTALVREVAVAKWVGDEPYLRHHDGRYEPTAGEKLRPTADSRLAWHEIHWLSYHEFTVTPEGALRVGD